MLLTACNLKQDESDNSNEIRVNILLEDSKNNSFDINKRRTKLLSAYKINKTVNNETLKKDLLLKIIDQAINLKDSTLFINANNFRLLLSKKLNDTLSIGESLSRFGNYYFLKEEFDSAYIAYNQAYKLFDKIQNDYNTGKMLYGMGAIKSNLRDYTGSEVLAFKAIELLKPLKKNTSLLLCYNLLGINFSELKEYNKAIVHYNKALEYAKKITNQSFYREIGLNNLGLTYHHTKQYDHAISFFKEALNSQNLRKNDIDLYATLIDNLTYTQFLNGDTLQLEENFNKSLRIRDSIHNVSGVVLNKLHLAEFYISKSDTAKALSHTKDAHVLAKNVDNHRDRLEALKLLAKLDKKNAPAYLEEYIALNDSLQAQERAVRNKFTRIQYETDEYIEETKRLSQQNILISIIGGALVLVFALLYFIKRQKARNKELLLESEQQKINQEVYALMLKQQSKLEEGRLQERHRISEELHDGVLGKLFGTRVGLGYLTMENTISDPEEFKSYLHEIQQIEKEIRAISHELKHDILTSKADFASIIEQYVSNQSSLNNFNYTFNNNADLPWSAIEDEVKVSVYRIVQEGIQNIVKHAKATTVAISFNLTSESLHLTITDNGIGFDTKKHKRGIGLKNMASRVSKLNGKININAAKGQGTTITVTIPL
ncbi:hypothetical protein GCM10022395_34570 [Snuella lapsa]|uniref:Oxygen sensor histidine kinase NreB n=1 Tax=Snuella lapsa TaxID=870481 RepID=A0ABP6YIZ7_9FLAO